MARQGKRAARSERQKEIELRWKEALEDRRRRFSETEDLSLEAFAPGTPGCHEALHLSSVLLDIFDRHLLDHPAVIAKLPWYALAWRAHENLFALYQEIGAAHLPNQTAADSGKDRAGSQAAPRKGK